MTEAKTGFTLIELSIVLVIIGLIVGGILTGRDLIDTAAQRAQIAQITKYCTAVNTFRNKYGYLPGDIPDPAASQFGFQPRGQYAGEGDGNGVIEGNCNNAGGAGNNNTYHEGCGELAVIWEDVSEAGLIDTTVRGYDTNGAGYPWTQGQGGGNNIYLTTSPGIKDWLPTAKLGQTNFIYVMSMAGVNYFAISSLTRIAWELWGAANPGITVQQAYSIDSKIDDGLPQSGNVQASYMNQNVLTFRPVYAAGNSLEGADGNASCCNGYPTPTTVATPYLNTNCFDNNNTAGTQKYSITQNANMQNCALSFKFQ